MYQRELWKRIKPYIDSTQAIVVTGVRRTGKTYLLRFIYNALPSANKVFLDLENPLNRKLFEQENYESIKGNLERLGADFSQKAYVFLDEIQLVSSIPSVVKYLIDHYSVKFFLTGSASFYLKKLFPESLAGRKFIFELFPLSFSEFLQFKGSDITLPKNIEGTNEVTWKLIEPIWEEYIAYGGFPEVVLAKSSQEKHQLLGDIFTSYFQKEIEQFSDFRKVGEVRNLIMLLAQDVGNLVNIERISKEMGISRLTIEEWLSFLQATYLVSFVEPFSKSTRIAIRKAKKVYFVDWGLAGSIALITAGQRLENCAYHLLRLKGSLSYFRKKSGVEVDFILNRKEGFEVKLRATSYDVSHLTALQKQLGLTSAHVVSQRFSKGASVLPGFLL